MIARKHRGSAAPIQALSWRNAFRSSSATERVGIDQHGEPPARIRIRRIRSAPADARSHRRMGVALQEARASSTRPSDCSRKPSSALPSSRSSTASSRGWRRIARLPGDRRPRRRQAARGIEERATSASDWHDRRHRAAPPSTFFEHGRRLSIPPNRSSRVNLRDHLRRATPSSATPWAEQIASGSAAMRGHRSVPVVAINVQIIGSDRVLGMLQHRKPRARARLRRAEMRLLTTVAASMGVALENARLFDETQRRTRESAALAEVGRDISSTLDLPTVMDRIARHAKELLCANHKRDLPAGRRQGRRDADVPRHRRGGRGGRRR